MANLASGVVQGYSAYERGKVQQEEMEYNAALAKNKAVAAKYAMQTQKEQHKKAIFDIIATTRAAAAGSGIEISGSALDVIMEAAREGEYEQRMIEYEGKLQMAGLRDEAEMYRYQGKAAKKHGELSALGSIIGGAAQDAFTFAAPVAGSTTSVKSGYQHHRADNLH